MPALHLFLKHRKGSGILFWPGPVFRESAQEKYMVRRVGGGGGQEGMGVLP